MSQVWGMLCDYLQLPEPLARRIWDGLTQSQWSATQRLVEALALPEDAVLDAQGLTRSAASPEQIITVLETCIVEGVIGSEDARAMEEAILRQTTRDGYWR